MKIMTIKHAMLLCAAILVGGVYSVSANFDLSETEFLAKMPAEDIYANYHDQPSSRILLEWNSQELFVTGAGGNYTALSPFYVIVTLSTGERITEKITDTSGFLGYTTDQFAEAGYITGFSVTRGVRFQNFIVGLDTPTAVPEPTTLLAGALLLLPFVISILRIIRKKRSV